MKNDFYKIRERDKNVVTKSRAEASKLITKYDRMEKNNNRQYQIDRHRVGISKFKQNFFSKVWNNLFNVILTQSCGTVSNFKSRSDIKICISVTGRVTDLLNV